MWKKILWIYVILYALAVVGAIGYYVVRTAAESGPDPIALILPLFLFLPPALVAFGLRGRQVPVILVLIALLVLAVPLAGIFKFNALDLTTIGKALIFLPMLAALLFFGFARFFNKKKPAV